MTTPDDSMTGFGTLDRWRGIVDTRLDEQTAALRSLAVEVRDGFARMAEKLAIIERVETEARAGIWSEIGRAREWANEEHAEIRDRLAEVKLRALVVSGIATVVGGSLGYLVGKFL